MITPPSPKLKFATKAAPLPKRLKHAQEAGFLHAELFLNSKHLDHWKDLANLAEKYNLNYGLHFPNRPPLSSKQLKKAVKLYRRLQCDAMVIHQPMYQLYGQNLLDIDPDLCLAVENHRLNLKNFWQWANSNSWLTLDVEHLWKYTLKQGSLTDLLKILKKFLKQHGNQVRRVHLPGYHPSGKEHQPISFNPRLGKKVFTALAKIDYQGLVVSETRPTLQTVDFLRQDVDLYEHWLKKRTCKLLKK